MNTIVSLPNTLKTNVKSKSASNQVFLNLAHTLLNRKREITTAPTAWILISQPKTHKAFTMIKNYLLVAYRNLVRYKIYSVINITGLAIGIAFCLLTFLYVRNEWTYDTFHQNADRIYRVYVESSEAKEDGTFYRSGVTPIGLGPEISNAFPDILSHIRFCAQRMHRTGEKVTRVTYGEISFDEPILLADPTFFDAFSLPLKIGDAQTALQNKNSVIISQEIAKKYFGNEDPMGKQLEIRSIWHHEKVENFTVTGIVNTFPDNSSIRFQVLLPYENYHFFFHLEQKDLWIWWNNQHTYVLLPENHSVKDIEAKLTNFIQEKPTPFWTEKPIKLRLQPLTDLHFNTSHVETSIHHGIEPPSDPVYSYVLSGIALIVLLIACINFVNLSLGRSTTRVKEVGIRKVVGANRVNLFVQFCGESIFLSFVALAFGLTLVELFLPVFNDLTGKSISLANHLDIQTLGTAILLAFLIGLFTGSYPSIVLSTFHPIEFLRKRFGLQESGIFRRGLVVIQFALSILFIVCTLVMIQQLNFVKTKDLGFKDDFLLAIHADELPEIKSYHHTLKSEFLALPKVTHATMIRDALIEERGWRGSDVELSEDNKVKALTYFVDTDFVSTLNMKLLSGHNLSDQNIEGSILVNEAFVRAANWKNPIGKTIQLGRYESRLMRKTKGIGTVIGVVKDFHFQSLHHKVKPEILALNPMIPGKLVDAEFFMLRIQPDDLQNTIQNLETIWYKHSPNFTFRYTFFDEDLANFYRDETRWSLIIRYTSYFAIFIACLGAFGLTTLSVAKRTKEIGIRKILGATIGNVISLLSREFLALVLIANLIAWPVAYWAMNKWLAEFAYRIDLGIGTFLLGGLLTLLIVIATVSTQAIKAARMNPVDTLRYE